MAPWSQRFGVMPVAVLVVFASAVALDLGRSRQAVALVGAKYLAILVLLPLSCLTLFAAGAKVPVFRVYPGLAALLVIWLFYGLYRILDAMAVPARLHGGLYALVLLAAIVSGITGSYRYYTQNYVQEIVYVKEQIEGYRTSHGGLFPEHVNVVFPSKDYRGNYGFYDGDVYNLSSADRHRPRLYFAQVLRELGAGNDAIERLKVTTAFEPDKLDSSKPNVLLIDMRPLRFFWGPS
jgi:hypothetical protein